ncbi:LOW QUALITY PROTEIN: cytochrome P450 2Y3 [Tautogolabrus adspersus]
MDFSATVIIAGLIVALLWLLRVKNTKKYKLPPGPTALPVIGNLPQLQKDAPFKSFLKLSKTYGPVMTVYLGWQRTIVLVGYDAVKGALVDQADDFTGRGPLPFLMKATKGYGLGISNGERWRQLRRFTLTTLRDFGMGRKGMEEWTQEESTHLRARIDTFKAKPFDPTFLLSCTVSNVICALVFGERFDYDDKQFLHLLNIIAEVLRFNSSTKGQMYNVFPWLMEHLPGHQHKVFAQVEELRGFIKTKIQEHKDTLDSSSPRDFIDCFLIRMNQEKDISTSEFQFENLVGTVLNLFLAGTETTSSTIRYALSVLIKYPNIQEKMQQEIDTVIGQNRCPNMEDRKSLPFTDAVIHEVQRFLDIVPLSLPHYALQDISFRGYTIPKGTIIIPLLHSVLKEEKQWETPWSFNPKHFLDQNGNFHKNLAFMPFAAGKRACVGESLARMELFIFMVSLLQRFKFSYTEGPDSINLVPEFSGFANLPRSYQIIATPRCMEFSVTLISAGLLIVLLWLLSLKSRKHVCLPPGPTALPIIGNLLQLDRRAPFKTLRKLSESYGPVITVYLGRQRLVVLVGYDAVKEALVDQADDFTGRGPIPFLVRATKGYGLAISNGERWRQLRRFTLTTLRDFGMGRKGMEEWIQEEAKHLVARINSTKVTPFDPTFFMSCTVSNVICCLVFGQRFSYDDDNFLHLLQIINDTLKFGSSPWGQLYNIFPRLMERLPGRQHKVFARIEELRDFTMKKIQEHQETLEPSSPRDYIDCFLTRLSQEKHLPTSEFHYENLVSTVLNLFLAGTETTSSTMRFSLNVLIKYPKIQEDMQQEIDTVIGQERSPCMEDRKSLHFTDAVLHEVQRLMDIVPMSIPHYALHDITFRGYTIPKVLTFPLNKCYFKMFKIKTKCSISLSPQNTMIVPLLHSVLKEEKQWETPWSFNPQHFLDHNGNFKKNPAFLPFSAGKRACVGESLARMEMFLFMVSLLQRFTFSVPGGPDSVDLSPEHSSFANLPRRYNIIATPRL